MQVNYIKSHPKKADDKTHTHYSLRLTYAHTLKIYMSTKDLFGKKPFAHEGCREPLFGKEILKSFIGLQSVLVCHSDKLYHYDYTLVKYVESVKRGPLLILRATIKSSGDKGKSGWALSHYTALASDTSYFLGYL